MLYNKQTAFCKLSSVSETINWSSANNSVLKINSLKYLLVFSFCDQIVIILSKYKLNKTGDSGHIYIYCIVNTLFINVYFTRSLIYENYMLF